MKVVKANSLSAKDMLMTLISKVGSPRTAAEISVWLTMNLGTDLFNAWIAIDNNEPVGVMTAEVVNAEGPTVYIAFNYMKPGTAGNHELVQRVEDWAKAMEVNKLLFYTKRSPVTFIKKYGFELVQSVLKKDI